MEIKNIDINNIDINQVIKRYNEELNTAERAYRIYNDEMSLIELMCIIIAWGRHTCYMNYLI